MEGTTYRERREAKAERLRGWADKREVKADATLATARAKAAMIPFGQPILVGHHSEGRDRNFRAGIAAGYDRGMEHANKAAAMRAKADNIEAAAAGAIYGDDPDAIEALEARIAGLEAERARIKAYNATCRKGAPDATLLTEAEVRDLVRTAEVAPYMMGKAGQFPAYKLTNLGGNINRNKQRLEGLRKEQVR